MHKLNSAVFTVIMMLLAVPNVANAGSWICESNSAIREITVERETSSPVPCSVVYDKSSEGQGSKVVWTAAVDGSYCEAKADGLAEKLKSYGWACESF